MSITREKSINREESKSSEQPRLKPTGPWRIGLALAAGIAMGAVAGNKLQQTQNKTTAPTPPTSTKPVATAVTALGRLEPKGEVIKVSAPSAGFQSPRVEKLLVKEGKRIKAGEVIAILDSNERTEAALEQSKREVEVARASLAKARAGVPEEIEAQKATVARLEAELSGEIVAQQATIDRIEAEIAGQKEILQATIARTQAEQRNAQNDYQRYQTLYSNGVISAQELENRRLSAQTTTERVNESQATRTEKVATLQQQLSEALATRNQRLASLRKQIDEAKANLNKIKAVRPTDVQVATAEVDRAIAAVKQAEADLALTYVKAPISGEIIEIHTRSGETVSSDGIAELGRTDQMVVVAEVLEENIGKVRLGQKVTITSENEAFAGNLKGTVVEIGREIGKQDVLDSDPAADVDARVVEVKISLSPEDSQRVSGLTYGKVVAEINI